MEFIHHAKLLSPISKVEGLGIKLLEAQARVPKLLVRTWCNGWTSIASFVSNMSINISMELSDSDFAGNKAKGQISKGWLQENLACFVFL